MPIIVIKIVMDLLHFSCPVCNPGVQLEKLLSAGSYCDSIYCFWVLTK